MCIAVEILLLFYVIKRAFCLILLVHFAALALSMLLKTTLFI